MEVTTYVNFAAVFFALLNSVKFYKHGLLLSFAIIFVYLALRFQFGNDYIMYNQFFDSLDKNYVTFGNLSEYDDHFEYLWRVLNKLFSVLGFNFYGLIAVISLVNVLVFYKLIKTYVPIEYYWLAIVVYVFNPDFMLIHLSAIRQLCAIFIMFVSLRFLHNKKYLYFVGATIVAYFFHSSALVVLLLIPLSMVKLKVSTLTFLVVSILYFSLFFLANKFSGLVSAFTSSYADRYDLYKDETGEVNTGLGFFLNFIYLILTVYVYQFANEKQKLILKISIFSLLLSCMGIQIMMIYRLNMYFTPALIFTFAIIASLIKDFFVKRIFIVVLVSITVYFYINFFKSDIYGEYYIEYRTILEN